MRAYLLLISMLMASAAHAKTQQGIVTRVSDGDTLWIAMQPKGKPIKMRMQGIDAPEICQAWGAQARDALKKRLLQQSVSVEIRAKDDFGRSLILLTHGGEDVGAWLVKSGHAWSYPYRRKPGAYAMEQEQARAKRIGLWAQRETAMEPRQFRRSHGACNR
jgi:micrococcal nuclease